MIHSRRLRNIPPYPFARWAARVQAARDQGLDVIRLDIGNPDLPPADEVIEALTRAAHDPGQHGYPGYRGIPALREAIAQAYADRFDVSLDPEAHVVPLMGSKEGIVHMALAALDPGDVVLVPDPGYAPYSMGGILAEADVYPLPLLAENGFLPDLGAIPEGVAERAKLMWLNYPNNPTGATADLGFFADAVGFARRHDLILCHDAPYCDVTYGGYTAPSVLQVDGAMDIAVEFNSFSKTYNMAGWRLGMAVGNMDTLAALAQIKSNIDSGIFRPIQEAGVRALSLPREWIERRNALYEERMDLLIDGLTAAGFEVKAPRATLYLWTPLPKGQESEPFATALLQETGVAVAPGPFFGPAGEGYVRISVTAPTDHIEEAMDRLETFRR